MVKGQPIIKNNESSAPQSSHNEESHELHMPYQKTKVIIKPKKMA